MQTTEKLKHWLLTPVSGINLSLFRIAFGALIIAESWGAIATGWVNKTFIAPDFTFPFIGFEFLSFLVGPQIYAVYVIMGIAGIGIMIGWRYRLSLSLFTALWTITYWLQKSNYNNHYYLLILVCLLMLCIPAIARFSFDVKRTGKTPTVQNWHYFILILLLGIVYTYAGLAKVNSDWLQAMPLKLWFRSKTDYILIGPLFQYETTAYVVAYVGILFDLLIIPLLLFRPTRKFAIGVSILFHLSNSAIFQIGIFPYLMIGTILLFIEKDTFLNRFQELKSEEHPITPSKWVVGFLVVFFISQLILPVRHHFIPGDVKWTEEGHRMAWRMMLRSKRGTINFRVVSGDHSFYIRPDEYVTNEQYSMLSTRPDMIWQFVQNMKEWPAIDTLPAPEIYTFANISVNGSEYRALIDPEYNMMKAEWNRFRQNEWLAPDLK